MKKCINFELSKKLNELWLLDNIDTEYWYWHSWAIFTMYQLETSTRERAKDVWIKTLTLEEAIEFLPKHINLWEWLAPLNYNFYYKTIQYIWPRYIYFTNSWKTLLEAIENLILDLLENNLLTK